MGQERVARASSLTGAGPASRQAEEVGAYKLPSLLLIHEALRADGEESLARSFGSLFWSGLGGGFSIALSVLAAAAIHASLPSAPWRVLLVALGVPVGYLIIMLGRQGLITESTMVMSLDVLSRPSLRRTARFGGALLVVTFANLTAALIAAAALTFTDILDARYRLALGELAARTLEPGFAALLLRSILGGWVVAIALWSSPAAGGGRVLVIFTLAYLTGFAHLPHLAAGSIEVLHAVLQGDEPWRQYLGTFLPAAFLGNLMGAFLLVALLNHLEVRSERTRLAPPERRA